MRKRFTRSILAEVLAISLLVGQSTFAADTILDGTTQTSETTSDSGFVVVLDAGHDATHTGAQYYDHSEETDTLKIAQYCRDQLLTYPGITVYMTRDDKACAFGGKSISTGECLKKRVEYTVGKKADYFVSFHLNAAPSNPEATGAEVYYTKNDGASAKCASLAGTILKHLNSEVGLKNRGIKRANYYVLNNTMSAGIPGVLIEHCFMTNEDDVDKYLSADSKLKKIGVADAEGIMEFLKSADAAKDESTSDTGSGEETVDIAAVKVEGLEVQSDGFYVSLSWDDVDDATSYQIYKYDDSKKKWSKLYETEDTEYTDTAIASGKTGTYKVRALQKSGSDTKKSKFSSKGSATAGSGQVTDLTATAGAFNRSVISWEEVNGAVGYKVSRQAFGSKKWVTVATKATGDGYIDETTKCGKIYRYKVRAYRTANKKKVWGKSAKATDFFQTADGKVTVKKGTITEKGIQVNWDKKQKATGYIVYKKASGEKKWKQIGKTKDVYFVDENAEWEHTYTYTVKAYRVKFGKVYKASAYDKTGVETKAGTKIEGSSGVTVEQMVKYYEKSGKTYPAKTYKNYGAETLEDFCQIVYDVCGVYDLKAELVWAQICKETGYLQFGGDVKPEQCNFAGIGATGGGVAGNSFSNVEEGVTAQVQHLKLYATKSKKWEKNVTIVDPRYNEDIRGKAMLVEWLGIPQNPYGSGWAAADNYGYNLISMMEDMRKL